MNINIRHQCIRVTWPAWPNFKSNRLWSQCSVALPRYLHSFCHEHLLSYAPAMSTLPLWQWRILHGDGLHAASLSHGETPVVAATGFAWLALESAREAAWRRGVRIVALICLMTAASWPLSTHAEEARRIYLIEGLAPWQPGGAAALEAFRQRVKRKVVRQRTNSISTISSWGGFPGKRTKSAWRVFLPRSSRRIRRICSCPTDRAH